MSERTRLTKILLDIIDRVKHHGMSTKVCWSNFSDCKPVTFQDFENKIRRYGFPLRDGDLEIIWGNIGIRGSAMTYSDFVRFITMETIDPSISSAPAPKPSSSGFSKNMDDFDDFHGNSGEFREPAFERPKPNYTMDEPKSNLIVDILYQYKKQILNAILDLDPNYSGMISTNEFDSIIQRVAVVSPEELDSILISYDPTNSGIFNYFTLFSDLIDQKGPFEPPGISPPPRFSRIEEPPSRGGYDRAPRNEFQEAKTPRNNYGYDGMNSPPRNNFNSGSPRGSFDDPVSRNSGYSSPVKSNRYGRDIDEIVKQIAAKFENVYDSSAACYHKWRGYSKTIGPTELINGARKDLKIEITPQEADEIIQRFGGVLNLGNFTRMIGTGSDAVASERKMKKSFELTEEDKTLLHVARQAKGKDWEGIFDSCQSVEELVQGLRVSGIYVLLNDIRPCYQKYGKNGMIRKIQEFIDSL
ncbi:hypothetical protein GPJ56_001273 [Histomonas meleagridis]|uniref:uncharacterized protein n=1 Tax=Histomonas meleagridis TaxID=135588 RepID=UPI0035597833|nr:hypothetical protein GPJ56_001273 [Histomonas meleagridis]KAH0805030.1 hypothetical protein GO595_001975 [Histomonas meleagridis]